MGDKKVVSSSTTKSTKTTTEADGTVVETTTTTTTEKYSDGTTSTKTKVETVKKSGGGGGGGACPGGPGGGSAPCLDPATCTAPKTDNTTDAKFIQDALDQHNMLRAKHGSPPLTLNNDLGKIAQAWANNIAKQGKMQHSTCGFGENVYWSTDTIDGKRPVDQWYSEIKDYNFSKKEGQKGTGHFTQVVWKSTKELGIALASGPKGQFVIANYNPPGNFVGKYTDNVQKA